MKKILAAMALAALVAGPALAKTSDRSPPEHRYAVPGSSVQSPDAVTKGRSVIGRDPDPWIRNEILRHSDSGWPDA
jgi:hypothetical protein